MKTWQFIVDEPLKGFIVNARPWSKKAKEYVAFKNRVRLFANSAGVPEEIPTGFRAIVTISVTWKRKARIDLSNILKAVEDGLWVRDRGIGEIHATKHQHQGVEQVNVTVGFEAEGERHVQGDASKHAV